MEQDTGWTWKEARIYAQKRADVTGERVVVFEARGRVYAMLLKEWHFIEPGTTMVQTFVPKAKKG